MLMLMVVEGGGGGENMLNREQIRKTSGTGEHRASLVGNKKTTTTLETLALLCSYSGI